MIFSLHLSPSYVIIENTDLSFQVRFLHIRVQSILHFIFVLCIIGNLIYIHLLRLKVTFFLYWLCKYSNKKKCTHRKPHRRSEHRFADENVFHRPAVTSHIIFFRSVRRKKKRNSTKRGDIPKFNGLSLSHLADHFPGKIR